MVPRALQAGVDLGIDEDAESAAPRRTAASTATPLLLREALANLVDNAIRYAGRGQEVTRARRAATASTRWWRSTTPAPACPRRCTRAVFERFVRATHEGTGCGLGLAIVKEIVERHAGRWRCRACSRTGCAWRVRLPLVGSAR